MSLTRSLFNEFRPLFRMLADEPFSRQSLTAVSRHDPFEAFFGGGGGFGSNFAAGRSPAVNLTEGGDGSYVLSAEIPRVKKENLDVHVGDNGRSITIQGRTLSRSAPEPQVLGEEVAGSSGSVVQSTEGGSDNGSPEASRSDARINQVANAVRSGNQEDRWVGRSSFTRTVWLPRPVDATKVSGKLEDGVLRLRIPKLEGGHDGLKVTVE